LNGVHLLSFLQGIEKDNDDVIVFELFLKDNAKKITNEDSLKSGFWLKRIFVYFALGQSFSDFLEFVFSSLVMNTHQCMFILKMETEMQNFKLNPCSF